MINIIFIICLVLIWSMLLYHMFLMLGGYLHFFRFENNMLKTKDHQLVDFPKVSILIPAHNEGVVIEKTLLAMSKLNYPKEKLEVILISDNSSDDTTVIGQKMHEKYSFIHVIETEDEYKGREKSSALNYGLKHSTGEYLVVYDADNTPERNAVYQLVMGITADPKAAAVVGKFRVSNAKKNLLTRFINIETICFQWMAQAGRWFWFKMTTIPGTNFIIRRSVIKKLNGWDEKALAEDTELTIRVYDLGYHIKFRPSAITWEQEPEAIGVWWRQRTRWARGNQYVVMKFLLQFLKLKRKIIVFDLFYFFFTYFLFFLGVIVSDVIFVLSLFIDIPLNLGIIVFVLWILAYILYVSEVFITLSIEKTEMTWSNFLLVLFMYFTYSQLWILLVIYALFLEIKRILFNEEVKWYKTKRFN